MDRRTWTLAALAALTAGWLPAPNCPSCEHSFGLAGGGYGQSLRLNVVTVPGFACLASLGFVDTNGLPVGPPIKNVNPGGGQAAFLDLDFNTLVPAFGQRADVRPVVTPLASAGVLNARAAIAEVFDHFLGITQALVPDTSPDSPKGSPNLGMMGITRGQTLRLSAVSIPVGPPQQPVGPPSCMAQLSFASANGAPIGPAKTMPLAPGQAASLDLDGNLLAARVRAARGGAGR